MARMTLDQLLRQNIAGAQIFDPLAKAAGISDWQMGGGGVDEGGNALNLGVADPSKLGALQGYTFDWQDTGPENTGKLIAYDPAGNMVGAFDQQDQSFGSALAEWAALAGAGFGGLALAGAGPLAGAFSGAGGAGTASSIGAGEGAAQLGAYTAANPLTASGVAASTLPAGGLAGLGGGLGAAGGGLGLTEAVYGAGGALGGGAAAGAAGAGMTGTGLAAGGGLLASLGGAKDLLPVAGSLLGTGLQLNSANNARDDMQSATTAANDLQRYMYDTTRADNMPALTARNSALQQMQALLSDPSSITKQPDYQFGMDQGTKALNNGAAARGMTYSGQQGKALQRYGQDYAGSKLNDSANRLMALASGAQGGASQIGGAGANYAGQVGNALMNQGDANAATRIVGGNALADTINGLTAYGVRKNWWGG